MGYLRRKKYHHLCTELDPVGKMLGGWLKRVRP
jgi:hypothetical protein